jgi:DNA modification methylase
MTVRILQGDCRQMLDTLPEASVQCCVTSPPYWGLRSYLPDDDPLKALEIGSEPTVDEWVATMVDVFRRVRRVLRDDGTLFLNLGDSYAGSWGSQGREYCGLGEGEGGLSARQIQASQRKRSGTGSIPEGASYKPKDLIGQPWLVAFALRADGWWLRQEIIWSKANPMPESARDRCTKSHEQIFLLSKSDQYFWDFDAMQEPVNGGAHARRSIEGSNAKRPGFGHGYDAAPKPRYRAADGSWSKDRTPAGWATGTERSHEELQGNFTAARKVAAVGRREGPPGNPAERKLAAQAKNNASMDEALSEQRATRNPRSVWHFPTEPFRGAHFATFPRELAQRCITAGTREGDVVLDPFGGSGTVGLVADGMRRSAILIDLDRRNTPMARDRIAADAPLFAEVSAA